MEGEQAPRVVVGVDGSASSLEALDWAGDYAAATGGTIELVAAWDWPNSYGWAVPVPDGYNPATDADRVLSDAATKLHDRHPGVSVETRALQGNPAQLLVEASHGAALLVVGSRGHGQFAGMLIGSVSEHCAARSRCPVVVFHRHDEPTS